MIKFLFFLNVLLPVSCFAQFSISGRILNQADTKPVANASVFLSNATIGANTASNGTFNLSNVKPGKYNLVVSVVGFDAFEQTVVVDNKNLSLNDIIIFPKSIILNEVKIKPHDDPDRAKYLEWFRDEFLGTSEIAKTCKILNQGVLFFDFDNDKNTLTATSSGFLEIENETLGYKIKYLLANFLLQDKDKTTKKIFYQGSVLFEDLKGSAAQMRRWQRNRQEVYENSSMHFLRAALNNRINEEGFRVQQFAMYANPERPSDSLINARINFYTTLKSSTGKQRDSLAYWEKKSKLPKVLKKLLPFPLSKKDIIKETEQPGQFALSCDNDGLYVAYNINHHYHINSQQDYLYNRGNTENTLINFNSPNAFFYSNGIITNPYSVIFYGVWGRNRIAELLPSDYEPPQSTNAQGDSTAIEKIITRLNTYTENHTTEKVYLHFDKPYYAAGDTMYFKAYVTMGEMHELSNKSGVLHVDLLNADNQIEQSVKLRLTEGVAWGDFALPDTLIKGNHQVRAYTQWMRNEGESAFFNQTIAIGSLPNNKVPESGTSQNKEGKPDLQFFPEGGSLVSGIQSKMAFKAIAANGAGLSVKGEILDNENKTVTTFASTHLGMGYFYLTPEDGKNYKAKITYADGTIDERELPKARETGITLCINTDSIPKASVRIIANKAYFNENKNKEYNLLIWSGGIATTVPCTLDSQVIKLDILKRHLKPGIATFTLFSANGESLCERLMFAQNFNQLNINLITDKTAYAKREKVNFKLNVTRRTDSTANGHFSISVIDETKVPVDENSENTILTNLLLTSDLKGYIEQPNYYFINATDSKIQNDLDLVMLTHGYRRFEWKKLLNNGYPPIAFKAENGLEISGIAENALGKPLINGTVSLINPGGGPVLSEKTDEKGNFHFSNLLFTDSAKFILQAVNANGVNLTTIVYNKEKPLPATSELPVLSKEYISRPAQIYLENNRKQHDEAVQIGKANGIMLKEVKIRQSKKKIIDETYPSSSLLGPGHADQVIHRSEFRGGGLFSDQFDGTLRGVVFTGSAQKKVFLRSNLSSAMKDNPPKAMLIVLDGIPIEQGEGLDIDDINVNTIETIEVLTNNNAAIYGIQGAGGVLVITTRRGGQNVNNLKAVGILAITVMGFYKARDFYTPKYEHPNEDYKHPDLRSTIYWQPELMTDKDGNASFNFFNADGIGTYRVVIEGIDNKGNLGRQVYTYKVE
jgi:hypothetical protein